MAIANSEAARQLARARWGTTRIDGLIFDLAERHDELTDTQRAQLAALAFPGYSDDETGD